MSKWVLIGIPVILAAALIGYQAVRWAEPPIVPATPSAVDVRHVALAPVSMESLASDLASEEPEQRRAAMTFLAEVRYQDREQLASIRNHAREPVARAALSKRLLEIYTLLAAAPPPISLHVQNATLSEVVAALNAEMGTKILCIKDGPPAYTLDAKALPFWEVVVALEKQRPFSIAQHATMVLDDLPMAYGEYAISGPFYVRAEDSVFTNSRPPSLFLGIQMQSDPRMTVSQVTYYVGLSGQATTDAPGGGLVALTTSRIGTSVESAATLSLNHRWLVTMGRKPADVVTGVRATAVFTVVVPNLTLEAEEMDTRATWEETLGDVKLGVTEFHLEGRSGTFKATIVPPEKAKLVTLRMLDGRGATRWTQTGASANERGEISASMAGMPQPPYKLQASVAESVREWTVKFEELRVAEPDKP